MLTVAQTREIWKTGLLPIVDFLALLLAAGLAYAIRYLWFPDNFTGLKQIYGSQFLLISTISSICIVIIYAMLGQYKVTRKPTLRQSFVNTNIGLWLVLFAIISYLYFNEYSPNRRSFNEGGILVSRFILGTVGIIALGLVLLGRSLLWLVEQSIYKLNIAKVDVAIIGQENKLEQELQARNDVDKVSVYDVLDSNSFIQLLKQLESRKTSEIYLFKVQDLEYVEEIAFQCQKYKIKLLIRPQLFDQFEVNHLESVYEYDKYWYEVVYTSLKGWRVITKRLFDLAVAICFLAIFGWIYILIAIIIKLDSPGSIFYASERIAPNGKVFKMYKFRRFKQEYCTSEIDPKAKKALEFEQQLIADQGSEANRGALYKIKHDPRMTHFGRFLEKSSLDELPQFFNVIIGNLSLVGPRAHQPREVRKYNRHHYKVLNIKPGITGFAQIKGRSDLHFEDEVKYDTFYVENWSFWLDLKILFLTPWIIIFKKHGS